MNQGRFCGRVARTKVASLTVLLWGLLFVSALVSPSAAASGVVSLSAEFQDSLQLDFSSVAAIAMTGQTLSVDFVFSKPLLTTGTSVDAQIFLLTENGNSSSSEDPYGDYVVFGSGSRAYLIGADGNMLDVPMDDWSDGRTNSPAPTRGILQTLLGNAGAEMRAYPAANTTVAGIHYDLVLPDTGQSIALGKFALSFPHLEEAPTENVQPESTTDSLVVPYTGSSTSTTETTTAEATTVTSGDSTSASSSETTSTVLTAESTLAPTSEPVGTTSTADSLDTATVEATTAPSASESTATASTEQSVSSTTATNETTAIPSTAETIDSTAATASSPSSETSPTTSSGDSASTTVADSTTTTSTIDSGTTSTSDPINTSSSAGSDSIVSTESTSTTPPEVRPLLAASGTVSLSSAFNGFTQVQFDEFDGTIMNGQTLSIDFVFAQPFQVQQPTVWSELFLQTATHNEAEAAGDYPYAQYVVFGPGTRAYLIDEDGKLLDALASDWQGGRTSSPAPTAGVLLTDRGWAGADMVAYASSEKRVAGIRFDLVLPNTGQTVVLGRIGIQLDGVPQNSQDAVGSISSSLIIAGGTSTTPESTPPPSEGETQQITDGSSATSEQTGSAEPIISIPNSGGIIRIFSDSGPLLTAYARVRVTDGQTPSGLLLVEKLQSNAVVNEFAAAATPLLMSGRTYVEVRADAVIRTALSFTNPNPQDVAVNFELRNSEGNIFRSGAFILTGAGSACDPGNICNQFSRFVDELPFSSGLDLIGTLTFTSTAPIAVTASRNFRDVMTNQPVVDLSVSPTHELQSLPHFAVGNSMQTQVVLTNPTGRALQGRAEFVDSFGAPVLVNKDGEYLDRIQYSIAPNGAERFVVSEAASAMSGSIRIVPGDDDVAPSAFATLSYAPSDVTTSEADIPSIMGTAFRMYAQLSDSPAIRTAVAIANPTPQDGVVYFSATDLSGEPVGNGSRTLPAWGKILGPLDSFIESLVGNSFQGFIRITTDLPKISVVGFRERHNEGALDSDFLFTSIVPSLETDASSAHILILPNVRTGEGFMAQTIFYSGTAGATSQGTLVFAGPDGAPIFLPGL